MKRQAMIQTFFQEAGYGFLLETVNEDGKGKRLKHFFHVTSCDFVPEVGQRVVFELGMGRKGIAALNISLAPDTSALAGGAA
jgi:cold shock CspA family protein